MAESVVSSVVQRLGTLLIQKALFLHGVREQVEWIERELRGMQCFLKDADSKRNGNDERVKNWVRDIRDVAYHAEDVIDTFVLKIEMQRRRRGFIGKVKRYALVLDELMATNKVGNEIERIKVRLKEINDRRIQYGIVNLGEGVGKGICPDYLQTQRGLSPHLPDDTYVVGFNIDKDMIFENLFDPKRKQRSIISIVGMGGLGKTTLAKKIYYSSEVRGCFAIYAWITVSQDYTIINLLKDIIKQVMGVAALEGKDRMEQKDFELMLYTFLKGKRYLVVMDDVWGEEVWNQIQVVFPNEESGSRVLLTTRSTDVAKSAYPHIPPHQLPLLNDEESWELFLGKVFLYNKGDEIICPKDLEGLGRKISKKCGGVPLAIVVVGGLLSRKEKSPSSWESMLDNMSWPATKEGNQCLDILALSYNDLPYHLKSCYLYLGSFPEDYEISVNKLIRLWIAEGFVKHEKEKVMEETAEGYLIEFIQRCLVQVAERRLDGIVKKCRIHDLLRDMCIREAENDQFLSVHNIVDPTTTTNLAYRRAAIYLGGTNLIPPRFSSQNLHTLLCFSREKKKYGLPPRKFSFKGDLKLSRVIDMDGSFGFRSLHKEIGSMNHLRYLRLGVDSFVKHPWSIENLCNLQTIDLKGTWITYVPNALWRIETLRHLLVPTAFCGFLPRNAGLKHLHTLKTLRAGSPKDAALEEMSEGKRRDLGTRRLDWVDRDLAKLTSLRKLGIKGLTTSHGKVLVDSLAKFSHLVSLRLSGESIPVEVVTVLSNHRSLQVLYLEGELVQQQQQQQLMISDYYCPPDHFPPNLTMLTLFNSKLKQDPMGSLEKLLNLRALRIRGSAYSGHEMVCSAGGFPRLQHLKISSLPELEEWKVEDGAMPSLTHLKLDNCKGLAMLPEGMQHLTALQELRLYRMSQELVDRVPKDEEGQDWYKIQHIPSIIIRD